MIFSTTLSKESKKKLRFLLESQYWSLEKSTAYQKANLLKILNHSYITVPFYRKRFEDSGLTPESCLDPNKFKTFPLLTKKDIQQHSDSLLSTAINKNNLQVNSTGGSTGTPLKFYQDENYWLWEKAAAVRAWKYFPGFTENNFEAILWGAERDIGKGITLKKVFRNLLREQVLQLNTFDLDPVLIGRFFKYYNFIKPKIIRGYASSLFFIANFLKANNITFVKPKVIVSSAEMLWPTMRETVESVFEAPVFDSYGSREVSQIATECSAHNGLHIVMENQFVEIVDNHLIITNLTNYGMPFIRYNISDLAETIDFTPCKCGRFSPRIFGLRGRESDIITLPNGKVVHGEYFTHLFYGLMGVENFTVHYRSKSKRLDIICADISKDIENKLKIRIENDFGFKDVNFHNKNGGEKAMSGKHAFVKVTLD